MIEGWPTGPVPSPAAPVIDSRYRMVGAILGAGLAFVAMAMLYLAASIQALESVLLIRTILEPELLGFADGAAIAWAVAPLCGAIAAWLVTPRALAADRWSGSAMGLLTYVVAVILGPLVILGLPALLTGGDDASPAGALLEALWTAPFISVFASVILLPLAVVCMGGGAVWAAALRSVVAASGGLDEPLPSRPFEARPVVVVFVLTTVGWLFLSGLFFGLVSDAGFVD